MTKFNKKQAILITLTLLLGLGLLGCGRGPGGNANQNVDANISQNQNTNLNTNTSTTTGEIDTSDWKIYRNEEYGFEFKYPRDWEISIKEEQRGYSNIRTISPDNLMHFEIAIFSKEALEFLTTNNPDQNPIEDIYLSGVKGIIQVLLFEDSYNNERVFYDVYSIKLKKNNIVFQIYYGDKLNRSDEIKFLKEKILPSFKFISN